MQEKEQPLPKLSYQHFEQVQKWINAGFVEFRYPSKFEKELTLEEKEVIRRDLGNDKIEALYEKAVIYCTIQKARETAYQLFNDRACRLHKYDPSKHTVKPLVSDLR
jgi:hypothetical protein